MRTFFVEITKSSLLLAITMQDISTPMFSVDMRVLLESFHVFNVPSILLVIASPRAEHPTRAVTLLPCQFDSLQETSLKELALLVVGFSGSFNKTNFCF